MSRRFSPISGNAYLLLMVTMVFWGGNAVAGRFAVGDISPLLLTWFRWNLGAAVLLFIARDHLRRDWPAIRRDLPYLVFMGAIGFAVFNALLYTALTFTTAINATIVQAGIPMFIFILNFLIFRTSIQSVQILGYSLTLIGVLVVASRGDFRQLADLDANLGDVIMIVAALVYALVRKRWQGLSWKWAVILLTPLAIDGVTHVMSDLGGLREGFRETNVWLAVLTNYRFPPEFYAGDQWGSFNSIMRLITGALGAFGLMGFALPYLDRAIQSEFDD